MAIIKCSVCGGELEVNADLSIGKCKYCDSTILIPKGFEHKGNLYNRAVFLRQNSEFDKAVEAYEGILKEDNTDVDAHWGLVLSKYGIEYVDDPRTGKKVPTCHRTQPVSILADPDYLAAIENADFEASRFIQLEANKINEIQSKILSIAKSEPPYDVFICYKESDELDRRTEDSVIAQDLYYELIKKGYKVFFARKTLEKKIGSEYEPIIYAALNSAQVMVVLGTKPENFTSVWVKNEWSRFLKMSSTRNKTIIPAFKGMSPYELPAELASLQALDMSKIGFLQELTDGIDRLLAKSFTKKSKSVDQASTDKEEVLPLDRLLQNGETFLTLKDFKSAENSFRKATEIYPQDYHGWWGLIKATTNNLSFSSRMQGEVDIWYDHIRSLCPEAEYSTVEKQYLEYLRLVAKADLASEATRVDELIAAENATILQLQRQINSFEREIGQSAVALAATETMENNTLAQLTGRETETQSKLESSEKKRPLYMIGGIITGIYWLVSVIGQIADPSAVKSLNVLAFIVAILLLGIPISLFSHLKDSEALGKALNDAKENTNRQRQKIAKLKAQHFDFVRAKKEEIVSIRNEIEEKNARVLDIKQQLKNMENALEQYLYGKRCERIGVTIPTGELDLPSWMFVSATNSGTASSASDIQEEIVTFNCPACGNEISEIRKVLIARGSIVCKKCGSCIDIERKGEQ